jgi:hypothetical protein
MTAVVDAGRGWAASERVPRLRRDPLPRALVEDLVAVARMLYRSWRRAGAPQHQLRNLAAVGRQLCEALELGKLPTATVEHARAWELAERATEDLGRLVGSDTRVLSLLTSAFQELERPAQPTLFQQRERERLLARRQRS